MSEKKSLVAVAVDNRMFKIEELPSRAKLLSVQVHDQPPLATVLTIEQAEQIGRALLLPTPPIAMRLRCPQCHTLHIDEGEFATRPHKTHTCQSCGEHFQPALVPTVGVKFLPGCGPTEQS